MTTHHLFLLIYLATSWDLAGALTHESCLTQDACTQAPDATSNFLSCVGLPPTDTGSDHMRRLRGMVDATLDVYSFMRSSVSRGPVLELELGMELAPGGELAPGVDPFQNQDLVRLWVEVQLRPLLTSVSTQFLSCLSTKNFSCSTYQTVVRELSEHFSMMDPYRQRWIYMFFIYPFLSGPGVAGCVSPEDSSEDWLLRNLGSFRAVARMEDFSALNMLFSGLEVLHLLTEEQKAELLLSLEGAGLEGAELENGTLSLVFHSLLSGGGATLDGPWGGGATADGGWGGGATADPRNSTFYSPPPPQNNLREVVNGFMGALRPIGSFVREFVVLTQQMEVSEIKSTTLTQAVLNWTLAELAHNYRSQNASALPAAPEAVFDVTTVEGWYQGVVRPVLRRFLPPQEGDVPGSIKAVFHRLFHLNSGMMDNNTSELQDACSITIEQHTCGLTDAVENVARVLHCAARTNLTLTEDTVMRLLLQLGKRLNGLVSEFSTANFSEVLGQYQDLLSQLDSQSLVQENLQDPAFISLWFHMKLLPLLPDPPASLLSCLSSKNFTCLVYHTLVKELSVYMRVLMHEDMPSFLTHGHMVYTHFLLPFLSHHNSSDPRCLSSTNHSAEWLLQNFGIFSLFGSILDFYQLNSGFSGVESLEVLSPNQTAELLLLPLPLPPEKDDIINRVFDFLLESPVERKLPEVLEYMVNLSHQINVPCGVYTLIFERLYWSLPSVPAMMEPVIWASIDNLMQSSQGDCLPSDMKCPMTPFNESRVCQGKNSLEGNSSISKGLQHHLDQRPLVDLTCNYTLQELACASLENVTANQLVSLLMCKLPGNSRPSKETWKLLLTKLSSFLDQALDLLSTTNMTVIGPSVSDVLDVIGEMRLSPLREEELRDGDVIRLWFSQRLRFFLASASGGFLHCVSSRNLSCSTYQQILTELSHQFHLMDQSRQQLVVGHFIQPYLTSNSSESGCVTSSSSSGDWLRGNWGLFSVLVSLRDLLRINPGFSPVESLEVLSPNQTAELLLLPLPLPQEKDDIINRVFDFLLESPVERKLPEVLNDLVNLSQQVIVPCSSYRNIIDRLDQAMSTVPMEVEGAVSLSKLTLLQHAPQGCIIYMGVCSITSYNETEVCAGSDSSTLQNLLDNEQTRSDLCEHSIQEFACASVSALTAEDLVGVLKCHLAGNSSSSSQPSAWKLFLYKTSLVLDEALDLLSNTTLNSSNPAVSLALDAITELRMDTFSMENFRDPAFIQLWFNSRLRPFLPSVTVNFLSCLSTKNFSCRTYQSLMQILSQQQPAMAMPRRIFVYTHLIEVFLMRNQTADPSCRAGCVDSGDWMVKNLGRFSNLASFADLQNLDANFTAMEAVGVLSVRQLVEVSSTPGELTSPAQVTMVMDHVPDRLFASFFTDFSSAVMGHVTLLPPTVRSAFLQTIFDRGNLSNPVAVDDQEVLLWFQVRLRPLVVDLSVLHVAPFFSLAAQRNCSTQQQGVKLLNATISSLSNDTKTEIYHQIVASLQGPSPLRCYGVNYNNSFYGYLERTFMGFQFPRLTTFLSLMPHNHMGQLVNSMSTSDMAGFLRRPGTVDNLTQLCLLYSTYTLTPLLLEQESLPEVIGRPTLSCVWPTALSSSQRSEVNAWFDLRLRGYLGFLSKSLLTSPAVQNATCPAFSKLVSVMGNHDYSSADFRPLDVFNIITSYLRSDTVPRCYVSSDPELNSTAWFSDYLGSFMSFLTLETLNTFGSAQVLQVFTVNPENLVLLSHSSLPVNLTDYYTQLVYLQDTTFNPLLLPLVCRCAAPSEAFIQLTSQESMLILANLSVCASLDPQVSAQLANNMNSSLSANSLVALGNGSTALSAGQLTSLPPSDLLASMQTLSSVVGWSQGQAMTIVQSLLTSGTMQVDSASSLVMLGTLVGGVPAATMGSISGPELMQASQNPSFLNGLMSAPMILQQTFVSQIIAMNSDPEAIVQNVPDAMATEIPPGQLIGFSQTTVMATTLNRKKWKHSQAALFFDTVAVQFDNTDDISSSVLQGFTCTRVATMTNLKIKNLIKSCRRRGKQRVTLVETQLTCMYNYIKSDSDVTNYSLYPTDMLLYYDYSLVPAASCRSYFSSLGDADFSVFSSALVYLRTDLVDNARSCLGITGSALTRDNVEVLGNMVCVLDPSYIPASHPLILESLKKCPDLTDGQGAAMELLLLSGTTQYSSPSTWDGSTLDDLGMLTLYLSSSFYQNFDKRTKRVFLRSSLKALRSSGVERRKIRRMRRAISQSNRGVAKRSIVSECTVGEITQVTIADAAFPFDYDLLQFSSCLSVAVARDSLAALTARIDQTDYLAIVLEKLRQAYNGSLIPDMSVQVLGPASRLATSDDISMWNITTIDTLSALMDPVNGAWPAAMAKAIISKYLSSGASLGSMELTAIGGPNLCSLDASLLQTITPDSLSKAPALVLTNCSQEQMNVLFTTAVSAFSTTRSDTVSASTYQLTQPYLGGATLSYVRSLSVSNISMDLGTFTSLNQDVVLALNVSEVQGLLGSSLPQLKSYENQSLVQSWVSRQYQSDLASLGVGLTGGKADPVPTGDGTTSLPSATTASDPITAGSGSTAGSVSTVGSGSTAGPGSTPGSGSAGSGSTAGPAATVGSGSTAGPGSTPGSGSAGSGSTAGPAATVGSGSTAGPGSTPGSGSAGAGSTAGPAATVGSGSTAGPGSTGGSGSAGAGSTSGSGSAGSGSTLSPGSGTTAGGSSVTTGSGAGNISPSRILFSLLLTLAILHAFQ